MTTRRTSVWLMMTATSTSRVSNQATDRFMGGVAHCDIHLPDPLPADLFNGLLLPCQQTGAISPSMPHQIKPVIQEQTQQVMPTEAPVSEPPINNVIKE